MFLEALDTDTHQVYYGTSKNDLKKLKTLKNSNIAKPKLKPNPNLLLACRCGSRKNDYYRTGLDFSNAIKQLSPKFWEEYWSFFFVILIIF